MTTKGLGTAASKSWESEFQTFGLKDTKLTMELFKTGVGHATQVLVCCDRAHSFFLTDRYSSNLLMNKPITDADACKIRAFVDPEKKRLQLVERLSDGMGQIHQDRLRHRHLQWRQGSTGRVPVQRWVRGSLIVDLWSFSHSSFQWQRDWRRHLRALIPKFTNKDSYSINQFKSDFEGPEHCENFQLNS